jgi:DNA helicase II / ATP-dependent DNA helicase PcrA
MATVIPIQDRVGLPTASRYQINFFDAVEYAMNELLEGRVTKSLLVDAKPGSGKTTTGVAATKLIPDAFSAIFVAFSKPIADELATRLPRGIPGKTLHSHWYRQWSRYCKQRHGVWPEHNNFKIKNAIDKYFGLDNRKRKPKYETPAQKADRQTIEDMADNVQFLVEKAKLFGVVPQGYPDGKSIDGMRDEPAFWEYLSVFFDHQIEEDELAVTIETAREILWQSLDNELVVDFADMLYMPAVKRVTSEKFMVVMVDECQDLSELQHFLLAKMLDPMGVLLAIGDRRQSIYGFTGADTDSMDHLKDRFKCQEFPLSISYRCARKIVDAAYQIYPEIEARPDAPEGTVEFPTKLDIDTIKPGHLIICRNNAPIVNLAYRLIRNRVPAKVVGRDIGKGLQKLIKRLDDDGTLPTMLTNLRDWKLRQYEIADRKQNAEKARAQIDDKFECIWALARDDNTKNVAELNALIEGMFLTDYETMMVSPTRVTLSTIHKIKGAEADTVILLDPHLINAPWMRADSDTWQYIQEENLRFVAITRAKTKLLMVKSDAIQ